MVWLGKIIIAVVIISALLFAGMCLYYVYIVNPKVTAELRAEPTGERAKHVMLLTLPTGNTIPVNYLKKETVIYVGADGRWWRAFRGAGNNVELFLQGTQLQGHAVAITNDRQYRDDIFAKLRPTVPTWLPEWMKGVLIEITIEEAS